MAGRRPRADYEAALQPPGLLYRKVVVDMDSPCSALCTNHDDNLLAVVGRKVFKILKLFPDKIEHAINLRDLPHKHVNLKFSSNDVQWNPKEEFQLATAPTNGSVVLWDINKRTKSKLFHAFDGYHQRAVNKLSFHPKEPNLLLSGSQDNTMLLFDTRHLKPVATYKGPDCVRDVKFATMVNNDNLFAACYDNGVMHVWDRRRGEHPVKQLPCHNGPVYCCAWHPEREHHILTAGRDKMIKGYSIESRPRDIFTISNRLSVARAKWRAGHKSHVTSCSHFLDNTVLLWDNRRPFIPYASFSEHSDDVTDFLWLNDQVLLTCSKDGKLVQQLFVDAKKPVEKASPVGLSFRPDGALAHACSENLARRSKCTYHNSQSFSSRPSHHPMSFRKSESEPYQLSFLLFTSSLREHQNSSADPDLDELADVMSMYDTLPVSAQQQFNHSPSLLASLMFKDNFVTCAKSYKFHGLPVHELCDHNYKVAKDLSLDYASQTWLMLKLLFCGDYQDCTRLGLIEIVPPSSRGLSSRLSIPQCGTPSVIVDTASDHLHNAAPTYDSIISADNRPPTSMRDAPPSSIVDSAQEENEEEMEDPVGRDVNAAMDFFESSDHHDLDLMDGVCPPPRSSWTDMQLPAESIQLRHDLVLRPPTPEHLDTASGVSTVHSGLESNSSVKPHQTDSLYPNPSSSSQMKTQPQWDFSGVVTNMLRFYAEQGDVQMSVSCLLVLGEKGKDLVDATSLEHWFSSYIDLLSRFKLWSIVALVIKLCPLPAINELSQQSTTYHTGCGNCNKLMESISCQCKRCGKTASECAVCHGSVKGLFVWCQVCGHGGHLQHIQEWHRLHTQCPTGCGHNCITSV